MDEDMRHVEVNASAMPFGNAGGAHSFNVKLKLEDDVDAGNPQITLPPQKGSWTAVPFTTKV